MFNIFGKNIRNLEKTRFFLKKRTRQTPTPQNIKADTLVEEHASYNMMQETQPQSSIKSIEDLTQLKKIQATILYLVTVDNLSPAES